MTGKPSIFPPTIRTAIDLCCFQHFFTFFRNSNTEHVPFPLWSLLGVIASLAKPVVGSGGTWHPVGSPGVFTAARWMILKHQEMDKVYAGLYVMRCVCVVCGAGGRTRVEQVLSI